MIGTSPATHKVLDHLATLSEYKFDIFISGESGAGKEVASDVYIDNRLRRIASDLLHGKGDIFYKNPAMKDLTKAVMPPIDFKALDANKREEEITNLANRLRGPLVFKDNIAAYSDELFKSTISGYIKGAFTGADKDTPGLLEKYNYGIIQFDEVGYLSLAKQEIMMRIADNREYTQVGGNQVKNFDIQFVFSTRFDLDDLVRQGKMLEDFAARIQKLQVIVPPLRERSEDIPLLAQHMVAKLNKDSNKSKSIDADTLSILSKMKLPTNVRQLDTIIRNLYTKERGSVITVHTLKNYLTDLMDQEKAKELRPQNLSTLTSVKEAMPGVEKGAAITR
jgi:DNA-binding NtrC family response regulator